MKATGQGPRQRRIGAPRRPRSGPIAAAAVGQPQVAVASAASRSLVQLGPLPELVAEHVARTTRRSLLEHARGVAQLSERFTSDREGLPPGYLNAPPARAAYTLYFSVTGAATVQTALDLAQAWPQPKPVLRVLDIGAGPLSASLGVAARLDAAVQLQVTAIDGVRAALDDGAALLRALRPRAAIALHAGNLREGKFLHHAAAGEHDLIILANVLNEWDVGGGKRQPAAELVERVLGRHLAPGGTVLLVEPATRAGSHALIEVREHLLATMGLRLLGPCLGDGACPLAGSRRDWCFSEQPWQRPPHIAALDKAIGHERGTLKFSYLALTADDQPAPAAPADRFRVIGGPMREGTTYRRYLCGVDGKRVAEVENAPHGRIPAVLLQAWRGDAIHLPGQVAARQHGARTEQAWIPLGATAVGNRPQGAGPRPARRSGR